MVKKDLKELSRARARELEELVRPVRDYLESQWVMPEDVFKILDLIPEICKLRQHIGRLQEECWKAEKNARMWKYLTCFFAAALAALTVTLAVIL